MSRAPGTRAKRTNVPIPKPGSTAVDPKAAVKQAIEVKIAASNTKASVQVDD